MDRYAKTWVQCRILEAFEEHLPGDEIYLDLLRAEELSEKGYVRILFDNIDPEYISQRIIEMADKKKDLLSKLVEQAPDDLTRHRYKRELKRIERGDLSP